MTKSTLQSYVDAINASAPITLEMIPDIDLYMDQLITFFDKHLSSTKRRDDDKLLTKTMINNYTKHHLLMPAKKKKYSREHILLMLLIYYLKQVTSMEDIQTLFNTLKDAEGCPDSEELTALYQHYLDASDILHPLFADSVSRIYDLSKEKTAPSESEEAVTQLLCLLLFKQSLDYKRLAEKLLDSIHD